MNIANKLITVTDYMLQIIKDQDALVCKLIIHCYHTLGISSAEYNNFLSRASNGNANYVKQDTDTLSTLLADCSQEQLNLLTNFYTDSAIQNLNANKLKQWWDNHQANQRDEIFYKKLQEEKQNPTQQNPTQQEPYYNIGT